MTSVKITDLTAYTDAASTDVLPIVDVGADVTKKIAIGDIVKAVPQGTAALPGLAFDGDPNTGLFSAGADQVGLATNGTRRLFIDSSGRLGLGTSTVSGLFHAAGSSPDIIIQDTQSHTVSDGPLIQFQGRGPNATNYNFGYIRGVSSGSNNAGILQFATNSAGTQSVAMTIDSSRRVGIGTTSPAKLIHVQSGSVSGAARGGAFTKTLFESSDASNSYWEFQAASTAKNDILFSKGNTGSYGIVGYDHADDSLRFHANSSERARITSDGKLGLGTSSPDSTLTVGTLSGGAPTVRGDIIINHVGGGASLTTKGGLEFKVDGNNSGYGARLLSAFNGVSAYDFAIQTRNNSTSWSTSFLIDSTGRVGLGISSPAANLDVRGLTGTPIISAQGADTNGDADVQILSTGTTGSSRLFFSDTAGSLGSIIYRHSDNSLAFNTNNTEAIRIDSSQRVGIGTTSVTANLELGTVAAANQSLRINSAGNNYLELSTTGATGEHKITAGNSASGTAQLIFETASGGTEFERARIDSSGRLLIGTSTARTMGTAIVPSLQAEGTSNSTSALALVQNNSNSTLGASVTLAKTRATSNGGTTVVQSNENLGSIYFEGADGTNLISAARIFAAVDGTPGANSMPCRLVFSVTQNGSASPTEAMRIKNTRVINFSNAPVYADNAAAKTGGLVDGDVYRTSTGDLKIVYT